MLFKLAPSLADTILAFTSYTGLKTKFASTSDAVPLPSKVAISPDAFVTVNPSDVSVPVTSTPELVVASFALLS